LPWAFCKEDTQSEQANVALNDEDVQLIKFSFQNRADHATVGPPGANSKPAFLPKELERKQTKETKPEEGRKWRESRFLRAFARKGAQNFWRQPPRPGVSSP